MTIIAIARGAINSPRNPPMVWIADAGIEDSRAQCVAVSERGIRPDQ